MTQQYQDIQAIVNVEITEDDRKYVRSHVRMTHVVLVMMTISVAIMLFLWVTDGPGLWPAIIATYLLLAVHYILKHRFRSKLWGKLIKDCRPDLFLGRYLATLERAKKSKVWERHLYTVGNTLMFAGRTEEAKALLELFSKYCPDNWGRMYFTILAMSIAYKEQNLELMTMHAQTMEQLLVKFKPKAELKVFAQESLKNVKKLELELDGRFEELQDLLSKERPPVGNLQLVKRNYGLYKIAMGLGKTEEASEYKAVVLEKGGTTFYKKELSDGNI